MVRDGARIQEGQGCIHVHCTSCTVVGLGTHVASGLLSRWVRHGEGARLVDLLTWGGGSKVMPRPEP